MPDFALFVAIGFAAQIVDGAIGMAFGLISSSTLIAFGTPPAVASASIHAAEIVTTGASGFAHWRLGNVEVRLVVRLAVPGAIGGVAGALLASFMPADIIRPAVSVYLMAMGLVILWRAFRPREAAVPPKRVVPLGLAGGFLDAAGGGGWGPLVTSTLIGGGQAPRTAIGSANAAEFFVTTAITAAFFAAIGLELWPVILGLILGGVLAAPFAALVARRLPARPLMVIVAVVLLVLSLRNLAATLA